MGDYYKGGDYNVICQRTGFEYKRSQCRREWNGLLVRDESWEPRHPQDLIRSVQDIQGVRDPRPEGTDVFLEQNAAAEAILGIDIGSYVLHMTGTGAQRIAISVPDGGHILWER